MVEQNAADAVSIGAVVGEIRAGIIDVRKIRRGHAIGIVGRVGGGEVERRLLVGDLVVGAALQHEGGAIGDDVGRGEVQCAAEDMIKCPGESDARIVGDAEPFSKK